MIQRCYFPHVSLSWVLPHRGWGGGVGLTSPWEWALWERAVLRLCPGPQRIRLGEETGTGQEGLLAHGPVCLSTITLWAFLWTKPRTPESREACCCAAGVLAFAPVEACHGRETGSHQSSSFITGIHQNRKRGPFTADPRTLSFPCGGAAKSPPVKCDLFFTKTNRLVRKMFVLQEFFLWLGSRTEKQIWTLFSWNVCTRPPELYCSNSIW